MLKVKQVFASSRSFLFGERSITRPLNIFLAECHEKHYYIKRITYFSKPSTGEIMSAIVEYDDEKKPNNRKAIDQPKGKQPHAGG